MHKVLFTTTKSKTMKTKILLLCFSIAVIPFIDGCGKYEEGPAFSLSSKKGRVVNTWKFEKVFGVEKGEDLTSYYTGEYIEFKKDGSYIWTDGSSSDVGTWAFAADKEDIVLTGNGTSGGETYHIIKLKGKEFWFRYEVTNVCGYCSATKEFHLSPR